MQNVEIGHSFIKVKTQSKGAELCSIRIDGIGEILWQADSNVWARHAPVLFPIVGKLKNDQYRYEGKTYSLPQHGFARDREFQCIYRDATRVEYLLSDDETTRAHYPFEFEFVIAYTIDDQQLHIDYFVRNPSEISMPVSIGAHPGFAWPLIPGVPKSDHWIEFEHEESPEIARLEKGLISPTRVKSPIDARKLPLHANIFDHDALIWTQLNSRTLRYHAADRTYLEMQFDHFPHLGIWSKPGADFICLEPWHGYASPHEFDGEITNKPGIALIPSNSERMFRHTLRVRNV